MMLRVAVVMTMLITCAMALADEQLLPGMISVRDFGAMGDGTTDDTEAFRAALAHEKADNKQSVIFIPRGTYLLSDTLGWPKRRTLLGENRVETILKLKDSAEGFGDAKNPKPLIHAAIRGPHYGNDSWVNAAFDNYVENLTIDTGRGNAGAIGLRYTTHNSGMVENVTIRSGDGSGVIGLDLSQTEFGPGMIWNVTVEGFDTGAKTPSMVSHATIESLTLRNQNVVGFENNLPVSIHNLRSENRVPAIRNGKGGLAQLVLIAADLRGGDGANAAIENRGSSVYLRNVNSAGYRAVLADGEQIHRQQTIDEFVKGPRHTLGPVSKSHLHLMIEPPPVVEAEPFEQWQMVAPSGGDDTKRLQEALDSGARTVFLRPGRYTISDTLTVPATVERLHIVKGAGLIKGDIKKVGAAKPFLRISGGRRPLMMEHIYVTAWPQRIFGIEIDSDRPVVLKDSGMPHPGGEIRNTARAKEGKLFLIEAHVSVNFDHAQQVWAWQYNMENNPYRINKSTIPTYLSMRGGRAWILGMKTEAPAIHLTASAGAEIELLGGFFRDHFDSEAAPYFSVADASLSATYFQFAHKPGAARSLHLLHHDAGRTSPLNLPQTSAAVGLLSVRSSQ